MTTVIDISGVNNVCQNLLTYDLHGGERISALQTDYPDQDRDKYAPNPANIAPRRKDWKVDTAEAKGKAKRGPKYFGPLKKLL